MWTCEPLLIKRKTRTKPVHTIQTEIGLNIPAIVTTISPQLITSVSQPVCGKENAAGVLCANAANDPLNQGLHFTIRIHQFVDFFNRVNNRGVMLAPELPCDFRIALLG